MGSRAKPIVRLFAAMFVTVAVIPATASAARAPSDVLLGSVTVPFASAEAHPVTGVTFVKDEDYTFEVSGVGLGEYSTYRDSCAAVPDQPCVYRQDAFYCYDSTWDSRCGSGKSFAMAGIQMVRGWAGGFGYPTPSYNPEHTYSTTNPYYGTDPTIEFGSVFGRKGNCDGPEEREAICSGEFVVEVWGPDPDRPPCSAAAMLRARASAEAECKLGKLPIGKPVSVAAPQPGKTTNISPAELPPGTRYLISEILFEREIDRIVTGLATKYPDKKERTEVLFACVAFGAPLVGLDLDKKTYDSDDSARNSALFRACEEVLLQGSPVGVPATAARGCPVRIVPIFRKGAKVTKRDRVRARRAISRRLRATCKIRGGRTLTVSLAARGDKPLTRVIGRRVGAPLARKSTTPAGDQRIGVRWQAKKRKR